MQPSMARCHHLKAEFTFDGGQPCKLGRPPAKRPQAGGCHVGQMHSASAPAKQTHHAETGDEKREGAGGGLTGGPDSVPLSPLPNQANGSRSRRRPRQ